jgi:hypothetical protein
VKKVGQIKKKTGSLWKCEWAKISGTDGYNLCYPPLAKGIQGDFKNKCFLMTTVENFIAASQKKFDRCLNLPSPLFAKRGEQKRQK